MSIPIGIWSQRKNVSRSSWLYVQGWPGFSIRLPTPRQPCSAESSGTGSTVGMSGLSAPVETENASQCRRCVLVMRMRPSVLLNLPVRFTSTALPLPAGNPGSFSATNHFPSDPTNSITGGMNCTLLVCDAAIDALAVGNSTHPSITKSTRSAFKRSPKSSSIDHLCARPTKRLSSLSHTTACRLSRLETSSRMSRPL